MLRSWLAFLLLLATASCVTPVPAASAPVSVDVDGGRLYSHVQGDPAQDVLFVPGAAWLEADLGALTSNRTVVFYDLRGRGRSDPVEDWSRVSLEQDLEDLEQLRARLGVERFSILGWSYNGALAVRYALAHPEHVERLILIAPLPARRDPHWGVFLAAFAARVDPEEFRRLTEMRTGDSERDALAYCRAFTRFFFRTYAYDPESIGRMRSDPCVSPNLDPDETSRIGQAIVRGLGAWDWRAELSALSVPTLVVHGEGDVMPLEASEEYASALGNARLLFLERAGHMPWIEAPERFFAAVEAFLAAVDPR